MRSDLDSVGPFEERYKAFLETISELRPNLHRYCARMTGSVLDGEDVVQEALFEAYRKLDKFDDRHPSSHGCTESLTTGRSISCGSRRLEMRRKLLWASLPPLPHSIHPY
jgi:hypothetical protein